MAVKKTAVKARFKNGGENNSGVSQNLCVGKKWRFGKTAVKNGGSDFAECHADFAPCLGKKWRLKKMAVGKMAVKNGGGLLNCGSGEKQNLKRTTPELLALLGMSVFFSSRSWTARVPSRPVGATGRLKRKEASVQAHTWCA